MGVAVRVSTSTFFFRALSFSLCRTPKRCASSCRRQLPLLAQVVQLQSWEASISSRIIRRCRSSRAVLVRISSPSRGSMEQEASILPVFTFSTMHMRQAPWTESSE